MRLRTSLAVFLALACPGGGAAAQDEPPRVRLEGLRIKAPRPAAGRLDLRTDRWIGLDGSVRTEIRATFSEKEYADYKALLGDPAEILRRLLPASPVAIGKAPPRAAFDDAKCALVLERTETGDVRADGEGMRSLKVEEGIEFVEQRALSGRPAAVFRESGTLFGLPFDGRQTLYAPPLSSKTAYDAGTHTFRWSPVRIGTAAAPAKLSFRVTPAERILTGAYKAYGFGGRYWAGRVAISNAGPGRASDVRVRHRVEGYSEWSPWAKLADVSPGETLVECFHPVFSAATAQLRSDTPANLLVEWTYTDGDGTPRADSDGVRLTLLGGNEFIFCRSRETGGSFEEMYDQAPLLAAWVSRDDAIIREVAALGAKRAGGAPANEGVFPALATLKGLYETLVANDVTYQHPPSLSDATLGFDNTSVQNVKIPRDVLRDRSGTCIDLAILYAAMVHATGMPAYLCVVPGHCFPVIGLPDGSLAAVEVTGVGGGGRMGAEAATFGSVFTYGTKELAEALRGPHVLVDLRREWTHGVSCPELPPVGPEFVAKRPLREKIDPTKQEHIAAMQEEALARFQGRHSRALSDPAGGLVPVQFHIAAAVDARTFLVEMRFGGALPAEDGSAVEAEVVEVFEGLALMNSMNCTGLRKVARVKATGQFVQLEPDTLTLSHWGKGLEGELMIGGSGEPRVKVEVVAPGE